MRLPPSGLIVLIGPSGAGKSHWAAASFRPEQIVSSDSLRAAVGVSEDDQRAGTAAFEVLDLIIGHRLSRDLLTVVDTLGLDADRRTAYRELARQHRVPCHAVVFDTTAEVCRTRNRTRRRPLPAKVLNAQLAARDQALTQLPGEGFDAIHLADGPAEIVLAELAAGGRAPTTQQLRFGLQLSRFTAGWPEQLAETVAVAEAVGFTSLWVMDHVVQIPQVGRQWDDMPESWTILAWLAAHTRDIRLGTLVSGVTVRTPAHLAKVVATLDVLSGGRALCGLGLAWWEWEHRLYGWPWRPVPERYELLEDALQLLPLMWGPGSPPFTGRAFSMTETLCYPRPVQEHVPILVGGSGERRTLRLAAQYADACNVFGDPATVERKAGVLARHCAGIGRDPAEVRLTHLSTATTARSRREVDAAVGRLSSDGVALEQAAARLGAGSVAEQIDRYGQLAAAGVQTAIVAVPDVFTPGALEAFGDVISAFEPPPPRQAW